MSKRKTSGDSASSASTKRKKSNGASKPQSKSAAAKSTQAKKNAAAQPAKRTRTAAKPKAKLKVTEVQRLKMIEEAAYYYSLGNPDDSMGNWLRAEYDIDVQIGLRN